MRSTAKEASTANNETHPVDILNLRDWHVLDEQEEEHLYYFTIEVVQRAMSCPLCGSSELPYRFGTRTHFFADTPMHGKHVQLTAKRRRYRCRECQRTFLDPVPYMSEHHSATQRLVNHIERETLALTSRTFLSLAHETGMTEDTVRNIFDSCVHRLEQAHTLHAPAILGMDELYLLGHPRCILTDLTNKTVTDLLVNRDQKTVRAWLEHLPEKERIQVVTMDMWQPYRNVVHEIIPQARIVIDRFHIVKLANTALETMRKAIRAELSDKQRRTLLHDRYVLLKRHRDLAEKDKLVLETWTENFSALGKAYSMKEAFCDIWDASTKDEAHYRYMMWQEQITSDIADAFLPIALTIENWGDEIFNYFDYNGTITNAFTEAKNGALKVVNRVGRGYSFSVIRAKVLFAEQTAQKYHPMSAKQLNGRRVIGN